jgi:hypothetical protein
MPYNNSGGRPWNQNQINFAPLQLEQEYDFADSSNDPGHTYPSSNAYAYSQQQLPTHSSSSLLGAFTPPPPSQSRSSAFGAAQGGHPDQTGGYVHGVYGSQSNNPIPPSTSAPYSTNPTTFNFSASTSTLQGIDSNTTAQKPIPNFLSSSPAATQQSFSQPSTSQQSFSQPSTSNSYYHSPPNDRRANLPQPKRHHALAFKDEFNQEDPDGEIGTDQKDGNKSKLYVLISVIFSHVLITL